MTEREMQELLWKFPEKLLNEKLKQCEWEMASEVGRADLVFENSRSDLLVVEVKKGKLPRVAIDQIVDYFGMVKDRFPDRAVELMVVANEIPRERRLALERSDIEPREISEKRFRDVARTEGYVFESEAHSRELASIDTKTSTEAIELSNAEPVRTLEEDDLRTFPRIAQELAAAAKTLQRRFGSRIPRKELEQEVCRKGHYKKGSVMPSDYCYNYKNKSPQSNKWKLFLLHNHGSGLYEYVGPNYKYIGLVRTKTHG